MEGCVCRACPQVSLPDPSLWVESPPQSFRLYQAGKCGLKEKYIFVSPSRFLSTSQYENLGFSVCDETAGWTPHQMEPKRQSRWHSDECCQKKWGQRGCSGLCQVSPWNAIPSEGPWLHTRRKSRGRHDKVKPSLFRAIYTA